MAMIRMDATHPYRQNHWLADRPAASRREWVRQGQTKEIDYDGIGARERDTRTHGRKGEEQGEQLKESGKRERGDRRGAYAGK